jgi:hypothetical protein
MDLHIAKVPKETVWGALRSRYSIPLKMLPHVCNFIISLFVCLCRWRVFNVTLQYFAKIKFISFHHNYLMVSLEDVYFSQQK